MKLHDFISKQAEEDAAALRLRELGKALTAISPAPVEQVVEAAPAASEEDGEGLEAGAMILTAGSKHVHRKMKHHD